MKAKPVEERIKEIIIENLSVDDEQITGSASLVDDLFADSLDCVEIVMAVEEEYGISIPDEIAEKIRTVQELIDCVKARISK
jgi:acyl carrier protein